MIKIIEAYLQKTDISSSEKHNPTDFIEVSNQMDTLRNFLFNTPLTNETKLELLKEELANGKYEIQSQFLANKLIEQILPLEQLEPA